MALRPRHRLLAIGVLFAVLAILLVWAGTVQPDPSDNSYPDTPEIRENTDKYVGADVSVSGTIIQMDPLTIEDTVAGETVTFTVASTDAAVAVGDTLWVFGTLQADNHIQATATLTREPWEEQYMYVVSFGAGLLVLGRLINGWTVDTETWSVVPRTDSLVQRING